MTVSVFELMIYSGGIFLLFLTPGPVWLALVARTLSGGVVAALPLALGVFIGDIFWPLLAIIGINWIASGFSGVMLVLRWIASATFLFMGYQIIKHAKKPLNHNKKLTSPGALAGFLAGLAVILGNPKAILFYIGALPGFFDLTLVNTLDIIMILCVSCCIPLIGNLCLSLLVSRVNQFLKSTENVRKTNTITGFLLIFVGLTIPLFY